MGVNNPRRLIVEGYDDLSSVAELMGAYIEWPDSKENAPIWIEIGKSAEEILTEEYLSVEMKRSSIVALGVVLDADETPARRYTRFRQICESQFPALPERLSPSGLIAQNADEKRLGLWVMPDNVSEGSLETFLRYLVPEPAKKLWEHATQTTSDARKMGAPFREKDLDKAHIHTWLAWQDPPDVRPGLAITKKILQPDLPYAAPFIGWFRELYQL